MCIMAFYEVKATKSFLSGLWCVMVANMLLTAAWVFVSISVVLRFLRSAAVCHQCCMLYILLHTYVSLIMLGTIIHVPWRAAALLEKMINMCCLALMILICMSGEYLHQKVKVSYYWYSFTISVMHSSQNFVALDCLVIGSWRYTSGVSQGHLWVYEWMNEFCLIHIADGRVLISVIIHFQPDVC